MRLSFDRLWIILAIGLPALVAMLVPLPAVDLAYQVRAGDEILRTGTLPAVDTWTFTVAGTPWTDQQWLAQVILSVGYALGGWELLAVGRAALVAGSFGLLAGACIARGTSQRTAAILSLIAFALAAPALALRPQLFGIAIFAALLFLAAVRRNHPRAWWLAPLLVAAWANLHGSFVLAPLLLGYVWLDDVVRGRPSTTALAVLVAGTLATALTPFGPAVWAYAADIGSSSVITQRVSEWQRTTPFTVPGLLFYLSALAAAVVAWRGRAALRWPDWLWLAGMFAIGAWTVRGLAWWPFGAAYALAPTLASATARPALAPTRLNTVVAAALGVMLIAALPWWRPPDPLTGRAGLLSYAPSGLAAALRQAARPGDRVFVPQTWASWFEWAVPEARYFLDSRFELYPADVWHDYEVATAGGEPATDALDRQGVTLLVLQAGGPEPLGWRPLYRDERGTLYERPPQ